MQIIYSIAHHNHNLRILLAHKRADGEKICNCQLETKSGRCPTSRRCLTTALAWQAKSDLRSDGGRDFVNRFTEGEALPMDWEEDMQLPTGNEIRFADEILPVGQDEIPASGGDEIRPLVGRGRGEQQQQL